MYDDKIYYEDQTGWSPEDFYALWRYFDRLFQYIGPTQNLTDALANLDSLPEGRRKSAVRTAAHQAKRTGKRDEELAAMDLDRMSPETRYLMKHMLIHSTRYELALERFPNLRGLESVGELGHAIRLSDQPRGLYPYYTQVGILL